MSKPAKSESGQPAGSDGSDATTSPASRSPGSPTEDPGWALFEASLAAGAVAQAADVARAQGGDAAPAADGGWGVFDDGPGAGATPPAAEASGEMAAATSDGAAPARQPQTADTATATHATAAETYLLCEDAGQSFAVPVRHVRRIVSDRETGVLPTRGRGPSPVVPLGDDGVLPLIDLVTHLGHPGAGPSAQSTTSVARSLIVCERGDRRFALRVDKVTQVVEIQAGHLQETPAPHDGQAPRPARFVTKVAGRTVLVLDLERLVPPA